MPAVKKKMLMKQPLWWVAVVVLLVLFVFIALSIGTSWMTDVENFVYLEVVERMSPVAISVMKIVTHMGDPIVVVAICLLLFAVPRWRRNYAVSASTSVLIAAVANVGLKHLFARARPDTLRLVTETSYSFPSGHAMINMALYATMALLMLRLVKNRKTRIALIALCAGVVVTIGFSRIFLGVHYVTDVVAGWCLGLVIAMVVTKEQKILS